MMPDLRSCSTSLSPSPSPSLTRQIEYFNKRRTLELRQRATVEAAAKAREANPANAGR
jgi:hypothetical protein